MKLIVVGREGQGKTTLIKRLQKDYTSNKNISTVGIQISKTRLQGSEATRNRFIVGGRTIVFHTWDFGGQQEYYATHQCFITPATLYILVFSLSSGKHQGTFTLFYYFHRDRKCNSMYDFSQGMDPVAISSIICELVCGSSSLVLLE